MQRFLYIDKLTHKTTLIVDFSFIIIIIIIVLWHFIDWAWKFFFCPFVYYPQREEKKEM